MKPILAIAFCELSVTTKALLATWLNTTPLLTELARKIDTVSSGVKLADSSLPTGMELSGALTGTLLTMACCERPKFSMPPCSFCMLKVPAAPPEAPVNPPSAKV